MLVNLKKPIFTFILKLLGISDCKSNMFIIEDVEDTQKYKDKNKNYS